MKEPKQSSATTAPGAGLATRRIDAVRYLFQPHHVRDSLALARQPSLRNSSLAGLQAAIAVAIALPLVHLFPWPHLIGFAALGALVALFGRFASAGRRNRIVFFCAIWQSIAVFGMSMASWLGTPVPVQLVLLALSCGVFFFVTITGQFGAPGALIFVFAVGASMGPVGSLQEVLARTAATAGVAALAWVICALTEVLRHRAPAERPFPSEPLQPSRHRLIAAARIALGCAIAAFSSHAAGIDHPDWAAMGTLAVMQGAHLHISMNRALQRMTGTVVGTLLAWLILSQDPSVWIIIAILVVLQFATEIIIGANYGWGQVLVTPMALLMTYLAAPHMAGADMAPERIVNTVLGACMGIVFAVLFSTLDDRRHLARHHAGRGKAGKVS